MSDPARTPSPLDDAPALVASRRAFLFVAGSLALAGCGSTPRVVNVPEPVWPADPPPPARPAPIPPAAQPAPQPSPPLPAGVVPRARWARGAPNYAGMDRMLPVTHVTIHHDALSPFTATDAASTEARIELIRSAHRNQKWADIGYHFIVDRAGRVYEGRPANYQGAHVAKCNEGNIGILVLGNFEVQAPSQAQMNALIAHVRVVRQRYGVPPKNVRTHREWPGAKTLCPGKSLQRQVASARSGRAWG